VATHANDRQLKTAEQCSCCVLSFSFVWGRADELRLSVVMGLRKGLSVIRGLRRSLTEDEQHKIADAIVDHLEQSNWKIEHGPRGPRSTDHVKVIVANGSFQY
jgi:hypothetical protein